MKGYAPLFATLAVLLGLFAWEQYARRNTVVLPAVATWDLPSCPQELTLQNGSRWAMPAWSEPSCEATIEWTQQPIKAVPVNPTKNLEALDRALEKEFGR
jgi:hypothetical protein